MCVLLDLVLVNMSSGLVFVVFVLEILNLIVWCCWLFSWVR